MSADERFKTPSPFCDFCASLRPIFRAQPSVYSVFSVGTLLRFEMSGDERFVVLQFLASTHHRHEGLTLFSDLRQSLETLTASAIVARLIHD